MNKDIHKSALSVAEGVPQPSPVNKKAIQSLKNKKRITFSAEELYIDIIKGNRIALSRGITLIESVLPEHQLIAQDLIQRCLPHAGSSLRIGITGVPGAGKSTFIETFGNHVINQNRQLAVLAIDPSSERSGGSILGDKTRMETLSGNSNAFIRPSPSGGSLGGVARKTRESIILCEAAGFDTIFIETVGVGQSETTVHSMVDFFLVVMIPGAGDELQGMKRGIMEMADSIIINKADGDNIDAANKSKSEYSNALHLFPMPPSAWTPKVLTCSALESKGLSEVWQMILEYKTFTEQNNYFHIRRGEQNQYWLDQSLQEGLKLRFFTNPEITSRLAELEQLIKKDKISSFAAAAELLDTFFRK